MARRTSPWTAGLVLLSLSGCAMPFQQRDADMNPQLEQALRLLQDRVDALETRLRRAEEERHLTAEPRRVRCAP